MKETDTKDRDRHGGTGREKVEELSESRNPEGLGILKKLQDESICIHPTFYF